MSDQILPKRLSGDGPPIAVAPPEADHPVLARLRARFPEAVTATHAFRGEPTAVIRKDALLIVAAWLRDDPLGFPWLEDLTAVDWPDRAPRFEVVYQRLPGGRWQVDDPKIVPPPKYEIAASMEALIHHFKLYTAGFRPPVGEVYQRIESPRGELGFYIVSDGGARLYRMRVRGPSFANVQVLSVMLRGGLLADVVAGIASMDFILGEVDR